MTLPTLLPGTPGCSHGSGFMGDMIRKVELETSVSKRFPAGDREAAWAGHVFIYVGGGQIVQAEWPRVTLSPVSAHSDAIWAYGQTFPDDTARAKGLAAVNGEVGHQYDVLAYAHYLFMLAHVNEPDGLSDLSAEEAKVGPICSGVYIRELQAAACVPPQMAVASTQNPDWTAPSDCLRYWIDMGWLRQEVPKW